MKNMICVLVATFSFSMPVFAGDCLSGNCSVVHRSRVVNVTKNVVRETTRLPKKLGKTCTNGVCRSRTVTVVR